MKKIFALLLAAALCLTACAAGEDVPAEPEAGFSALVVPAELAPVSQPVPGEAPEPDYALYISSQPVPAAEGCAVLEYLPVYCINNTGENGSALFIPRLEMQDGDGAWTEVPFKEGIGFCGMSDPLPTGVTQVSENIPLLWGSLEEGRYRISYALGPDAALDPDAQRMISGEFTVCTPENGGGLPQAARE